VIESNHVENTDHNSIQVVGVSAGPDVTITGNTLINWDQNRDADGGRAIRINFDPVDAETALSVIGNTFEPNDNSAPVDADYVKITGVSTVDNAVENLIDSLIWQNTWPNGTNYSTVILVNSTTGPDLELPFSEEGPDTITIEPGESVTLTVADNNQEEINVIVPIELIQYLDQNKMDLEIETPFGRISIAAEDLGAITSETDLEFIVNPSTNSEAPTIEELADLMAAADINTDLTGKEIVVIGLPLIVTSDIYNVEVSLIIPLADYDEGEIYYVYVEHSDGEEVLVPGTVVDFGDGKGIQITVNRFSTFTVLALEDEVPEETTETSATEGTSETSATETTETSPTEESTEESSEASDGDGETLPKTGESAPVIPYLMIVLAGLALAISIRIRLANGKHVD
ncbi:MAG: LPXTG cell wall anchor domain-containing protein, partial [Clostridiaceae bacterium]|nr:LPXTG cell wall anchor domain-containing protein [Clostridiaceae bacterium]